MFSFFKHHKHLMRITWKEGYLFLVFVVLLVMACTDVLQDGNPLGPSPVALRIASDNTKIIKTATFTFTAVNGQTPYFWEVTNSTTSDGTPVGTVVAQTGVFTALSVAGTGTINVTDANGATDTATIEVLPNQLVVTPGNITIDATVAQSQDFEVAGGTLPFNWTFTKDTSVSSVTITIPDASITDTVTVTIPAHTADENYTISVSDTTGDVGGAKLNVLS
ncbi:MAG: hypothetical protein VX667_05285 [Nitrospinota bacterium]|nr:hypothetical protein [Nitrospinota bacterium]